MRFDNDNPNIAWCPGCGNHMILSALKQALEETDYTIQETMLVSGIGQAAKAPQYIKANYFNGLHGRALPAATAIKACNPELKVVVTSGDGDIYGEGGDHFIHAIRRNPDMTLIVFNNMIYGLTTGQASPTSRETENEPFNPVATAITQNISFAARAFARDIEQTKNIILEALNHKGFALVDVLTPCVSFNKINTYDWFAQNTFYLDTPQDRLQAMRTEFENEKMPLGVLFKQDKPTLKTSTPLYKNRVDLAKLNSLMRPAAPSQGP